jgi:hypothetical protein
MPKFEIILKHTTTSLLRTTVSAKNEEAAREKITTLLRTCLYRPGAIATHTKEQWEVDEEEIEIDEVNEL